MVRESIDDQARGRVVGRGTSLDEGTGCFSCRRCSGDGLKASGVGGQKGRQGGKAP